MIKKHKAGNAWFEKKEIYKTYSAITKPLPTFEVSQFKINREVATLNRIASVSGKASLLASAQTFTGNANYLVDEMNKVKNLRASDVMRVLETYVYKKNAVVLSAYPKGKPTEVAHFDNFELDTTKIYEKAFLADKAKLTYVKAKDNFSRDKQPISGAAPVLEVPKFWKKTFENKMKVIGTYSWFSCAYSRNV